MTENLKSIVQSVNKCLKTDYNLISFDSLSEESLLQVLVDVFFKFDIINVKVRKTILFMSSSVSKSNNYF